VPLWHVATRGRMPCLLSWPEACMRGYPVCRVPAGRISHSRCTSHVAATVSGRILDAFRSSLLASSPPPISQSTWRHSPPTDGSGILVVTDVVGISTWRAGAAALWIAFVEDTTALTYDFHATDGKRSLCKIGFVCLLDHFTFLTRAFTCLPGQLRIATRRWAGIRLRRHPLQHDGRIRRQ
jgi:hypothetical protein